MQQNAQQAGVKGMSISTGSSEWMKQLRLVQALSGASERSLKLLAEASAEVHLTQGRTLRAGSWRLIASCWQGTVRL